MPDFVADDDLADFISVFVIETGEKTVVPKSWMEHPVLKQGLRKTPLTEKQQREADALIEAAGTTETPA